MQKTKNTNKIYDLEKRTTEFAKSCRTFSKKLPRTVENNEDRKQLVRSSGSVGANYIEANESLSKKDCVFRLRVSRKESKESQLWLEVCDCEDNTDLDLESKNLHKEAGELRNIFTAMINKF